MSRTVRLRERVAFQERAVDANGDKLGAWRTGFAVSARVRPLLGGEAVLQSRLAGVQPFEITVRASPATTPISTAHRAKWEGRALNIRSVARSEDRLWIRILCDADGSNE